MRKSYENDMTTGPMFWRILLFALPVMASNMLQILFNAVDIIVVGKCVGDTALAAVGSTGSIYAFFVNFALGLGVGTNVVIGKYYGAKRPDDVSATLHTSILMAIFSGLSVGVIALFVSRPLLLLLKTPDDVIDDGTLYLMLVLGGSVFNFIYNFAAAALRAVGDTKRPLYYLLLAGMANVLFNLFFVVVCQIGVAGVALGTILSQAVSAFLVLNALRKETGSLHFSWRKMRIHKEKLVELIKIGLPSGIQGSVFSFSNMIIQTSLNTFGAVVMAGSTASANIEAFFYNALNGFHVANVSITSQNYGAKNYQRIKRSMVISLFYVIVLGIILGFTAYSCGRFLLSLYTDSYESIEAGFERLRTIIPIYFTVGTMEVLCATLRGTGRSTISTVNSLLGSCGFRVLWIFTVFQAIPTISNLYIVFPLSWLLTSILHGICLIFVLKKVKKELA